MCAQDSFKMASMEMDYEIWMGMMDAKDNEMESKWHYDVTLDDCVEKAWEGIRFIG